MASIGLEMLRLAVSQLGDLVHELVFVGGCTTELLITDEAAGDVRPTDDVDAIVEAATYAQYQLFAVRLQTRHFAVDTREGAPLCRWVNGSTVLDVMPLDEKTLGFTNIWYREAMQYAQERDIGLGITVRIVSPPYFCATKLEAFTGRGGIDYLASHDLEDLVTVIDGRSELLAEIAAAPDLVRKYISHEIGELLSRRSFRDALPGYLLPDDASQARLGLLVARLTEISKLI